MEPEILRKLLALAEERVRGTDDVILNQVTENNEWYHGYRVAFQVAADHLRDELRAMPTRPDPILALRNIRAYAIQQTAGHPQWDRVIRFCAEGGVKGNILR